MSDALTTLGNRVEERFLHAVDSTGGIIQHRADLLLGRASQVVRRSSIILIVGLVGVSLLVGAWVMFNVALHTFLATHWSLALAHTVVAGVNFLGGGGLVGAALALTPHSPEPPPPPRRRMYFRHHGVRGHSPSANGHIPVLAAAAQPRLNSSADNLENALSATVELGMLAARTIPQLVRVLRRG